MQGEIERRSYYGEEIISMPRVQIYHLRTLVKQMVATGEIHEDVLIKVENGWAHAYVVRRKPRPKRWPWVLACVLIVLAALAAGLMVVWQMRHVLATAIGMLLAAWVLLKSLAGHRTACPGLHCSGCRG